MTESSNKRPKDDLLVRYLGAAVLLCWHELPIVVQGQSIAQVEDVTGLTPIPGVRDQIARFVMLHAPR